MNVDLACLGAVAIAALAGAFTGARRHLARLGALAAGWAGARALGPALAPALRDRLPAFAAAPAASVLAFVGCAVAARLLLGVIFAAFARDDGGKGGTDRALGAVLGAAQAALALWVLLSALAAWARPITLGALRVDPAGSELVSLAREHSALGLAAVVGEVLAPSRPPTAPRRPGSAPTTGGSTR